MRRREQSLLQVVASVKATEVSHPDLLVGLIKGKITNWVETFCNTNQEFAEIFQGLDRQALVIYLENIYGNWLKQQAKKVNLPSSLNKADFRTLLTHLQDDVRRRIETQLVKIQQMSPAEFDQLMERIIKFRPPFDVEAIFRGDKAAKQKLYDSLGQNAESIAALKEMARSQTDEMMS